LHESKGTYFPADIHETDENAKKLLTRHIRCSNKRVLNPPLLLNDLTELGMFGELSEDQRHITKPFKDLHRLVTTMIMAELSLNERIQNKRNKKLELIKVQLNADNRPNMLALLVEIENAKAALTQKHSFQSVEMFSDEQAFDLEGIILFETLLINCKGF
jgi:hypothetical protein